MRKKSKSFSYKGLINIPSNLADRLPTSFDVIGDILLIKIDDKLEFYKEQISEALLIANKNIKTVCQIFPVSGELRIRDIKIIGGKKSTETFHKEYGLKYCLDIKKTYFSPRLANERNRIKDSVKNNEIIVDMFTGVAPFAIMIAKYANPKIIYAFDKNYEAIKYAQKNVTINQLLDKIELINEDSKNAPAILKKKNVKVNRVIMNLPFSAFKFFSQALDLIGEKGIIHYYDIIHEDKFGNRIQDLEKISNKKGYIFKLVKINKIKSYSPREFYIGIDITAKRK